MVVLGLMAVVLVEGVGETALFSMRKLRCLFDRGSSSSLSSETSEPTPHVHQSHKQVQFLDCLLLQILQDFSVYRKVFFVLSHQKSWFTTSRHFFLKANQAHHKNN